MLYILKDVVHAATGWISV